MLLCKLTCGFSAAEVGQEMLRDACSRSCACGAQKGSSRHEIAGAVRYESRESDLGSAVVEHRYRIPLRCLRCKVVHTSSRIENEAV